MSVEMGPDGGRSETDGETLAAVDELDGRPHLVVADVSREEAWAAVEKRAAVALEDWA
jgi:hypothetical protein